MIDPRVKRTRKLLLSAFEELLAEKGFRRITVLDIADRAEVNRATFYAHFRDKYALLDYHNRVMLRERLAGTGSPVEPLTADNLSAVTNAVFAHLSQMNSYLLRPTDEWFLRLFEAGIQQELEAFVRTWLDQVELTGLSDRENSAAAIVISWAIFGATMVWSRAGMLSPAHDDVSRMTNVLLNGVT